MLLLLLLLLLSRFSHVQLFAIPGTEALQAPLSTGLSKHEYWSGLLCPPPGDFPDPGTEPGCLTSALATPSLVKFKNRGKIAWF